MTNYEFNQLPFMEQTQTIWDHGTYHSHRTMRGHKINFYSLFDFYVEVSYKEKSNEIDKVVSFTTGKKLEYYISQIDLEQVLEE